MWAPDDFVFFQPMRVNGPEEPQGFHGLTGIENVVDHAFEVVSVVGEGHNVGVDGGFQIESVIVHLFVRAEADHLTKRLFVSHAFEVRVVDPDATLTKIFDHSRVWKRKQNFQNRPKFTKLTEIDRNRQNWPKLAEIDKIN